MYNVLIAYASRTGDTTRIGELIAEGIRMSGFQAKLINVIDIKDKKALEGFDAYVFGAPTYHGEMLKGMKTFLFLAEKAELEGTVGGAFGAFGWSGEAAGRIYDTMRNIFKMDMVSEPLMLKSSSLGGGIKMAQDYGRSIAKKLESK